MADVLSPNVKAVLDRGTVIVAHPLALDRTRRPDERRQRALSRYYIAAGAGGLAIGVHTTQFAIRDPQIGLFEPLLELTAEEMDRADDARAQPLVRIAGICGRTAQAVHEAQTIADHRYHAGLLSLAAMKGAGDDAIIDHCRAVAQIIPIVGFYLQPAVGGPHLGHGFWRRFAQIEQVVAIKIAPFNRYHTLDVVRAVAEAGRDDIALYTGNDDNIIADLLTPFRFRVGGRTVERRIVGGLLGHWAVWTKRAVEQLQSCQALVQSGRPPSQDMWRLNVEVTDANAAFFDGANNFAGCIPGLHEVLRRQGLLEGLWCLDENETLGPGQLDQIERVYRAYPHLNDDAFVAEHCDEWLR